MSIRAAACPHCGRQLNAYAPPKGSEAPLAAGYIMALLIPFIGIILGIYILTKGEVGHAIFVILFSLFMMQFWWGFWIGFYNALLPYLH